VGPDPEHLDAGVAVLVEDAVDLGADGAVGGEIAHR